MSKNELTPEVLSKLENAALGTLAKKSKEGDPVAARALLDRVDKIRQKHVLREMADNSVDAVVTDPPY